MAASPALATAPRANFVRLLVDGPQPAVEAATQKLIKLTPRDLERAIRVPVQAPATSPGRGVVVVPFANGYSPRASIDDPTDLGLPANVTVSLKIEERVVVTTPVNDSSPQVVYFLITQTNNPMPVTSAPVQRIVTGQYISAGDYNSLNLPGGMKLFHNFPDVMFAFRVAPPGQGVVVPATPPADLKPPPAPGTWNWQTAYNDLYSVITTSTTLNWFGSSPPPSCGLVNVVLVQPPVAPAGLS